MTLDKLNRVSQLEDFTNGSGEFEFEVISTKEERYAFVEKVLRRFAYKRLRRPERGIVLRFLVRVSGFSRQQLDRLVKRYQDTGYVKRLQKAQNGFEKKYTLADIRCLAQLDQRHDAPNGMMVKKLCERGYKKYKNQAYERLSNISVSHIYNMRQTTTYLNVRINYEKTKSKKGTGIGVRKKPHPEDQPGFIRIDTVHQGDHDGEKGVYHINAVDEVTQFEVVVSVEKISEFYLIPALELLLSMFPFRIINFHSDNGSEYVNNTVAKLLGKLLIEFTKSRPRRSNDKGLSLKVCK